MDEGGEYFIPCSTFIGERKGYFFGKSDSRYGVGYYRDDIVQLQSEKNDSSEYKGRKRLKTGHGVDNRRAGSLPALEGLQESKRHTEMAALGRKEVQKLVQSLERRYNDNVLQREKYGPNEPDKFLHSEVELDAAIQAMHVVTASGNLYPELVDAVPVFLSLVMHENNDIVSDIITLLSELTEADAVEVDEEETGVLVGALIEGGIIHVLVERLRRMAQGARGGEVNYSNSRVSEETAMYNALSVLENLLDIQPEAVVGTPGLIEWLCAQLQRNREVDSIVQYASEILAVVLQSGGENARAAFVQLGGVDMALQAIAPYRSKMVATTEEEEFVENVFDIMCAILMENSVKQDFVNYEGIELMILFLKGRTSSRTAALKCLDFVTTRFPGGCDRAIDKGILPLIFGIFMGKLKIKKDPDGKLGNKLDSRSRKEEEEVRTVSIISNLIAGARSAEAQNRVRAKFVENEFEKCDRLLEVFSKFAVKVSEEEKRIQVLFNGEHDEEELLMARMDAGLFTLQQTAMIIADLWSSEYFDLRQRILTLLHQRRYTLAFPRNLIREYLSSLGSDGSSGALEEKLQSWLVSLESPPKHEEDQTQ